MYLRKRNPVTCVNILREQDTFLVTRDPSERGHGSLLVLDQMGMDTSTNVHPRCGGLHTLSHW